MYDSTILVKFCKKAVDIETVIFVKKGEQEMPIENFGLRQAGGKPVMVIAPVDHGFSGGKIRPVIVRETRHGLSLQESSHEEQYSMNTYEGGPDNLFIGEMALMDNIQSSLARSLRPFGARTPVIVTVDTMGAGAKVIDGDRITHRLFLYTHGQKDRGMDIVAEKLTHGNIMLMMEILHSESGGQSWVNVYNLYHLAAMNQRKPFSDTSTVLTLPDAINWRLCGFEDLDGRPATEMSFVRTGLAGTLDGKGWNAPMLEQVGLPVSAFPKIIPSGTLLGDVRPEVLRTLGVENARVVAGGTHDTAGAFYALKLMYPDSIFISSGTWNLVAMPVNMSSITNKTLARLFKMRLGIEGATGAEVLIRNVDGGMLFDALKEELGTDYSALFAGIESPDVPFALLDVQSPKFGFDQGSGKIMDSVHNYLRATGRNGLKDNPTLVKTIYIGAMLGMLDTVEQFKGISDLVGTKPESIVTGGGVAMHNPIMMQALADASGLPVIFTYERLAGLGNAAMAIEAVGLASRDDVVASLMRGSSRVEYEPKPNESGRWQDLLGGINSLRAQGY